MVSKQLKEYCGFCKRNGLLFAALSAWAVLWALTGKPVRYIPAYVDWDAIVTLSGLLLITTAIKESGFFHWLAFRISKHIANMRRLAMFLVFTSAVLAMFLTNDIALFIMVPLTLSLQSISNEDYIKLIVFEAIAVNSGSSLTAVGNPQNILLWHKWGLSFPLFIKEMLPLGVVFAFWLGLGLWLIFPSAPIDSINGRNPKIYSSSFWFSIIFLIVFILTTEFNYDKYCLGFLSVYYLFFRRDVLKNADWGLILLFIIIFIDVNLFYRLHVVNRFMAGLDLQNGRVLFVSGALISQIISNVPATILLVNYSSQFKLITYAVNIGGNGLLIASFANIIALRFIKSSHKYRYFHEYSILYFLVTAFSVYILLL